LTRRRRETQARWTKLSTTFFSPAFSKAMVSLLPSTRKIPHCLARRRPFVSIYALNIPPFRRK
jgi:hypothetical protein